MYEELQVGLDGVVTPERMEVILETYRQLTEAGMDTMNDELLLVFNMQDGIADNAMLVSRVEDCLMLGAMHLLREHGITVRQDIVELTTLNGILQTINGFEHYIIPETLWSMTTPDEETAFALSRVVPLFSDVPEDTVMETLEQVDASVIERMHALAETKVRLNDEAEIPSADHNERIGYINGLARVYDRKHPALVMELAENSVPSGQSLMTLFEQVFEQLDNYVAKELGPEFLGLVLYSDTPLSEVYAVARDLPQEFTDSGSEQYRIEHSMDQAYAHLKGGTL
jgi:hypothetical protein